MAQYPGEKLMELAAPVVARLRASYGNGLVIVLTGKDITGSDRRFRFLFAQHDYTKGVSLISAARLLYPGASGAETQRLIATRLLKFMLRAVGEHLYKLPRTTDIGSVMYSPIMSLDDLDAMGVRLDGGNWKPPDEDDGTPISRLPTTPRTG